jgi:hypothetical protein
MTIARLVPLLALILSGCGDQAPKSSSTTRAEPMSAEDFRRELVGMPLCGTAKSGELAGKLICTVHLPDGRAIVAGAGLLARGIWETDGRRICRRDAVDPPDRRRCVTYERLADNRYRNSDGVEFCIGPCP